MFKFKELCESILNESVDKYEISTKAGDKLFNDNKKHKMQIGNDGAKFSPQLVDMILTTKLPNVKTNVKTQIKSGNGYMLNDEITELPNYFDKSNLKYYKKGSRLAISDGDNLLGLALLTKNMNTIDDINNFL